MTPCAEILRGDKVVGHISYSDNALLSLPGVIKPRWCPRCRMWLLHRLEIRGDSEPSYYDPWAVWACRRHTKWKDEPVRRSLLASLAGEER